MTNNDIPPLLPPEDMPAIKTQSDLARHWRALMGPLGFSRPVLWLMFLDPSGRCDGMVTQVDEIPETSDPELLANLLGICAQVIDSELQPGSRVAFLRSLPGPRELTDGDRSWARGLLDAAREAGLPCEPVHLATDEAVRVIALDDLEERRSA